MMTGDGVVNKKCGMANVWHYTNMTPKVLIRTLHYLSVAHKCN